MKNFIKYVLLYLPFIAYVISVMAIILCFTSNLIIDLYLKISKTFKMEKIYLGYGFVMILILIVLSMVISSCSTSEKVRSRITVVPHYYKKSDLHKSGYYIVKSRSGNVTEFREVTGRYAIYCNPDTIKPGSRIYVSLASALDRTKN